MQSDSSRPSRKRLGLPFALALIVLVLALLVAFIFYRVESWPGRFAGELGRTGQEAATAFMQLAHLQPQVTVNNRVYLEQTTSIAQLAVKERQVEVEHEMLHSWAGSTKRIKLHGTFTVKAGFDLHKKFRVDVSPREVLVELPHAEILSVEQRKVDVLAFENGYWNRLSDRDVAHELAALPDLARAKASDLSAEAEASFTSQLLEKFHPPQPVRVVLPAPAPRG
jgi:hypothetical protein